MFASCILFFTFQDFKLWENHHKMASWVVIFILITGSILIVKFMYIFSIAFVLPITMGAVYVSTSLKRIETLVNAVPMKKGQILVDLGCGDGRILRMASKKYGVTAIGCELNPMAFIKAKILCMGYKKIQLKRVNFFKINLSDADFVFCYLFPDVMKLLSEKLKKELKPGAVIVSFNFAMPDFKPKQVIRPKGSFYNDPIYVYKKIKDV